MEIKDLIDENIVVICATAKEAGMFCDMVFKSGIGWANPVPFVSNDTCYCGRKICYKLYSFGLTCCGEVYARTAGYEIIPFPEFIKQYENSEKFQLEIKRKKDKTVAVLKDECGKYIRHAVAKCSPEDTYDYEAGKKIALQRLFGIEVFPGLPDNRKDTINALIAIVNRLRELE